MDTEDKSKIKVNERTLLFFVPVNFATLSLE